MKNYRLYIQFFHYREVDGILKARKSVHLEITVTALSLFEAKQIKENDLKEAGYSLNEFLIYKVIPDVD